VTSSDDERPGSVSEPCARKAPRQAATASQPPPTRRPAAARDRAAALVEQPGLAGQRLAVLDDAHDVAAALADAVALHHHDVGLVAVDLGDVRAQPPGGGAGVELGLDHDLAAHDVQPAANRSIEATSALRQQVFVIWVLASSAFTCAVIAMGRSLHARQRPRAMIAVMIRSTPRPASPGRAGLPSSPRDVRDDQSGAVRRTELAGREPVAACRSSAEHGVDAQVGRVLGQDREVVGGPKPAVSPASSPRLSDHDAGRRSAPARRAARAPSGAGSPR
jgi:hypothetical protein